MPYISIIVLNWNGAQILPRCLDAVAAQTFRDFEVIVVDNASNDRSMEGIEARWPGTRVLRLEENLGFAAANNHGARQASGEWIALLNNDAFPEPDWLERLVEATKIHPEFSFFSSRLVQANSQERIDNTGDICHISALAWHRDLNQPVEQANLAAGEVFSPCAAAALYRRDAFLWAGGFDEDYFSHHEDIDLGFRLRLQGNRCLYIPTAVVMHIGSASFGAEGAHTIYQMQRNMVWTYAKNMPGLLVWKYLPAHLLANLIYLIHYSSKGQARPIWRAKWDALHGLPKMLKKRQQIQKLRTIRPSEIARLMDRSLLGPYTLGKSAGKIRRWARRLGLDRP